MAGKFKRILQFLETQIFKLSSGSKQETSDKELFKHLFLNQETEKMKLVEDLSDCLSLLSVSRLLLEDKEKTELDSKKIQLIEQSLKSAHDKIKSVIGSSQPLSVQQNKLSYTLEMLCRQFCNGHENINMRSRIENINDENVPYYLKVVVCKILQKTMERSHLCFGSTTMNITLNGSLNLIFEDDAKRGCLNKEKSEELKLEIESLVRLSNGTIKRTTTYPEGRMIIFSWELKQEEDKK